MITPDHIRQRLDGSLTAITWLKEHAAEIHAVGSLIASALTSGRLLMTAGNGGSAAEALHFSEEVIGKYRTSRRPYRSICLNADPTALTCIANDFGFEHIFARQIEALGQPGDLLVGLSTSGQSPNILKALETARARGCITVGLLGSDGGRAASLCDHSLIIPGRDSAHIQEAHLALIHIFCEFLEP